MLPVEIAFAKIITTHHYNRKVQRNNIPQCYLDQAVVVVDKIHLIECVSG